MHSMHIVSKLTLARSHKIFHLGISSRTGTSAGVDAADALPAHRTSVKPPQLASKGCQLMMMLAFIYVSNQ